MANKELEVMTYMPTPIGTVFDEDLLHFQAVLDLYMNKALDLNRQEGNVRIAIDRVMHMIKNKYEHVGMEFMVIDNDNAVGKAIFYIESGEMMGIDVVINRVGECDTTM